MDGMQKKPQNNNISSSTQWTRNWRLNIQTAALMGVIFAKENRVISNIVQQKHH